jgi:hypothetical protein
LTYFLQTAGRSAVDELARLSDLKAKRSTSDAEFAQAKAKMLA